jgi:sec-independent protein translocase protein TatC
VPVVVAFVAMIGVASAAQMGTMRRYVWFGMAIVAAIVTPPDVGSMLFLLVPMALLYEVGLIAARFLERERGEGAG